MNSNCCISKEFANKTVATLKRTFSYCHNLNFYLTEASVHRFYSLNLMSSDIKTLFVCNVMVLIFMKATELGTCYIFLRKHKKSQYKLKVFSK